MVDAKRLRSSAPAFMEIAHSMIIYYQSNFSILLLLTHFTPSTHRYQLNKTIYKRRQNDNVFRNDSVVLRKEKQITSIHYITTLTTSPWTIILKMMRMPWSQSPRKSLLLSTTLLRIWQEKWERKSLVIYCVETNWYESHLRSLNVPSAAAAISISRVIDYLVRMYFMRLVSPSGLHINILLLLRARPAEHDYERFEVILKDAANTAFDLVGLHATEQQYHEVMNCLLKNQNMVVSCWA